MEESCRSHGRQPITAMTLKYRAVLSILLLCAGQTAGLAESKPLELKWTELAPMIAGQRVELALTQGSKVKGDVVVVREDSIVMNVTKVSAAKTYQKGSAVIPRGAIRLIRVENTRGGWGRNLGTTIGVLTGILVGGYVAGTTTQSAGAGIPLFLVIASALTVGGYHAGKRLDVRVVSIRIMPE